VQGQYIIGYHTHDGINFNYFICEVDKDCTKTQNYTKQDFEILLNKEGITYTFFRNHKNLITKEWIKRNFWNDNKMLSSFGCMWFGLAGCDR